MMRRRLHFAFLTATCGIVPIGGFSTAPSSLIRSERGAIRRRQTQIVVFGSSGQSDVAASNSCPFSKHFPKYRIDFTRVESPKEQGFSLPFVSDIQKSLGKSQWDKKFQDDPTIQWLKDDVEAITIFEKLWRSTSDLSSSRNLNRVVVGITSGSHLAVVQHWIDMLNWMQNVNVLVPLLGGTRIDATIHNEGEIVVVELVCQGDTILPKSTPSAQSYLYDPAALTKSTQSWVKRILVDQGICPFTKSVKVSGQGLGDFGISVAKIHYCSSDANQNQISMLMADSWREIAYMLDMGPSGKEGISSILLTAPEYDHDFDLWSGPVFAMLESGVVACGLEKQVGVVCFHPKYATPDGKSFPGFGHMHSLPRLKKWLQEHNQSLEEKLTDDEIAAGGAWQRRTPHATINVLRADQLEAAEGRRVTSELYAENIRKLVGKPDGIGSDKLKEDLVKERALR